LEILAKRPTKIALDTTNKQNEIELTASSLAGKGYSILLVFKFESDRANIGILTIPASRKGKKLVNMLNVKIAAGNLVDIFILRINSSLQVLLNLPLLKEGIFLKKTNFQFVNNPPLHLFKIRGC